MTKTIYFTGFFVLTTMILQAQGDYQMKGNADEVDANFLFGYYQQDGNNGAVTGGIGTEELQDYASMVVVNIPLDTLNALSVTAGADYYTSASTDNIDNNVSSASSKDIRAYGNLGYTRKNLRKGETYGVGIGGSSEYDYSSVSGRISFAKEWNEGNSEVNVSAQAFIDRWSLYFPAELRREVSVPTTNRQSYNFQATWSQVLNKRMQLSLSGEVIYMTGLLSTPFHRVYFSNQTEPDIERLPDTRLKIPVGLRFNYFPTDNLIVRSYYRYYRDDYGIRAHTVELELPVKLSPEFTVYPFYRYHTQTAADYFAPYKEHLSTDPFYTSDYDLSALDSHKVGLGFTWSPLYGVGRTKIPLTKKLFVFDKVGMRAAYYTRSTGLNGFSLSLDLAFKIK